MSKESQNQELLTLSILTQNFLNDDGKLSASSYTDFWDNLPKRATAYLTIVITKLLAVQTGDTATLSDSIRKTIENVLLTVPDSAKPIDPEDKKSYQLFQNLLTTMYFVVMFHRIDSEFFPFMNAFSRFNSFRERIKQTQSQTQTVQRGSEQLFIDEMVRILSSPNYLNSPEGLKFLIQQACLIEFPEDFDFDRANCHLIAPSLVNSFLRRAIVNGSPTTTLSILDIILDFFRHPSLSEDMVLALLHMLRSYILLWPQFSQQLMKKALDRIKQYYIWPRPYCDYTRDILELLSVELKAPGIGFRSRFVEEIPELFPGRPHTGKERTVYLILDRDCANVSTFHELLKNAKPSRSSISELQANLTANIFMNCLGIDPSTLRLEYCNEKNIEEYFLAAMEIMMKALVKDEKEAETFRNSQLMALKETILQNASNTTPTVKKITHPKLPSLEFVCKVVDCNPDIVKVANWTNNIRQGFLQRPTFAVLDEIFNQNLQAFKANFSNNPQSRKPIVRIGIVGNDSSVASVVTAYVGCRLTKPEYFSSLDIRFYLIPIHTCRLANFIGKCDKWYGRHVVCLNRCLFGVYPIPQTSPTSKEEAQSSTSSEDIPPTPAFILRSELETYFRDALWPLNVSIFQCECFKNILESNSLTIPFCQRAEICVSSSSLSSKDANGNVRFVPFALNLKFLQVNPLGVPRLTRTVEPKIYEQVLLTSVPWPKDVGTVPHPTHTWLELYLRESDIKVKDAKKKEKEKTQKKDKTTSKLGRSYHVCSLEVEPQDRSRNFEIFLDGIRYGPFAKIKITTLSDPSTETVYSLPIMTYLPSEDADIEP